MPSFDIGESIPSDTAHAVSVSLPTWKSNVGYEEGQQWVVDKMVTGYPSSPRGPRFFIHKSIQALASDIVSRFGQPQQQAMLFPTRRTAQRCYSFIQEKAPKELQTTLQIVDLVLSATASVPPVLRSIAPSISAVFFVPDAFPIAKQYWQHSGDGVSSRRAEFCHGLLREGLLVSAEPSQAPRSPALPNAKVFRGPRRYQRPASIDATNGTNQFTTPGQGGETNGSPTQGSDTETIESSRFLEERFGRNLDLSYVSNAKSAIRRRIAGVLSGDVDLTTKLPTMDSIARGVSNFREDDIYLTPCGMNAIFTAHQTLLKAREPRKSINFGFPYVDTLKILQKFGPGAVFYGRATAADLDDLEGQLKSGTRFLALFCEFPGNPLLACPDLIRVRKLADEYDFAVVIDETIGTFVNVNVLPYADMVVSSLTKIFSGDCNVMGGGLVLNPESRYYGSLKQVLDETFEEKNYWAEDVMFMERNSRDFKTRIDRVNTNAEAICEVLVTHPNVLNVYYPKFNESRPNYEACKTPHGGYGGLLSCTLRNKEQAIAFYDALDTAKGPSLGTNFTLTSPYVLLAHYQELDWAASYGVDPSLVRVSVGLEETELLKSVFTKALKATEEVTAEAK
ncbi:Cystathionine gamma-synthase [Apiospora saccharicola]|uniref:Cystathionine gamma-synthase n=1 Tax=Apiospora saccharicola TaxID=335842 RepID=A0ABR1U5H9_9PEZI